MGSYQHKLLHGRANTQHAGDACHTLSYFRKMRRGARDLDRGTMGQRGEYKKVGRGKAWRT